MRFDPPPIAMDWSECAKRDQPAASKGDKRLAAWAKAVKVRDGYSCTKCGSKDDLHAHHVIHKAAHPDLKYEVGNGITLCATCHSHEHENLAPGILAFPARIARRA